MYSSHHELLELLEPPSTIEVIIKLSADTKIPRYATFNIEGEDKGLSDSAALHKGEQVCASVAEASSLEYN